MKYEKTLWFSGDIKPVRDGVYERDFGWIDGHGLFSCFENGVWHFSEKTPNAAAKSSKISTSQNLPWRGLTKDPKG